MKMYGLTLIIREESGATDTYSLTPTDPDFKNVVESMIRLDRRILEAHIDEIARVIAQVDDAEI